MLFFLQAAHYFIRLNLCSGHVLQNGSQIYSSSDILQEKQNAIHMVQQIVFMKLSHLRRMTKTCCILRDRREQYRPVAKGTIQMSYQRLSLISQYPLPDTIPFITLKCVIPPIQHIAGENISHRCRALFTFQCGISNLLPLRKVLPSGYFF